jgi:histidinol-phosphate aminotransferase
VNEDAATPAGRVEPRDDLQALAGYHSPQLDVAVRLNTNESPFPPPRGFVVEWTRALAAEDLHRYPSRGAPALRAAIGAWLGQPAASVFPANGSNEVLQTILLTYGGHGRSCLLFEPTYALHAHIARLTGTGVLVAERRDDFTIDPHDAVARIERERPAVTFVCSPNNPTGTVEPRATVEQLLAAARAVGGLLVVDEAYADFADWSAVELVADDQPIAVVRTYSKVWSLAALRLGFCIAPAWVVEELDKVALPYHLSVETQLAGQLALQHEAEMRTRVARLVEERGRVEAALHAIAGVTAYPSGANFVLFRVHGDAGAVWKAMLARGVLVRDFSRWQRVEDCLRVTIGTVAENDAFLAALREALTEVGVT